MNDRRFFRVKRQMQLKTLIDGLQLLVAAVPLNLPIAVPDAAEGFVHRGDARSGSVCELRVEKLTAIEIAHGAMREEEIFHVTVTSPRGTAPARLTLYSHL